MGKGKTAVIRKPVKKKTEIKKVREPRPVGKKLLAKFKNDADFNRFTRKFIGTLEKVPMQEFEKTIQEHLKTNEATLKNINKITSKRKTKELLLAERAWLKNLLLPRHLSQLKVYVKSRDLEAAKSFPER